MYPIATLAAAAALLLTVPGCTADRGQASPATAASSGNSAPASHASTGSVATASPAPPAMSTSAARVVAGTSAPQAVTRPAPARRTQQIIRRPVTTRGRVAAGYTAVIDRGLIHSDCGDGRPGNAWPSPAAVDAGVVRCGPAATYTPACWNGPDAGTAYCYRNPWQRQVIQVTISGRLPVLQPQVPPSPLGLVLSDGTKCTLRIGGAWPSLDGHQNLDGTYGCQNRDVTWGTGLSDGIDRTGPLWKVQLAPGSGHGTLHSMTVRTVYFVGTARS